ncbi:hypothetical protein UG55_103920 [Frankia sp. EI5c]|nr:hypothetical protein UG55_103920 [Frankia sp. EI5c]
MNDVDYIISGLLDLDDTDLADISSSDPDVLAGALAHLRNRIRRPGEALLGQMPDDPTRPQGVTSAGGVPAWPA